MKLISTNLGLLSVVISGILLTGCAKKFTTQERDGYVLVNNKGGSTLGYRPDSGVKLLTASG